VVESTQGLEKQTWTQIKRPSGPGRIEEHKICASHKASVVHPSQRQQVYLLFF